MRSTLAHYSVLSLLILAALAEPESVPASEDNQNQKRWGYTLIDNWHGANFFQGWNFFTGSDPTHGLVKFVNQSTAIADGLAFVEPNGVAVMRVDSTSNLPNGTPRNSVRISTQKAYGGGLFVLDAINFPFGCGVWPAFWMFGPNWPNNGEVDIFEGVNLGTVNQYTAHTAANCSIDTTPSADFAVQSSSSSVGLTSCGPTPTNSGCAYADTNQASYGPTLNANGGSVIATEWTSNGIKIWNFPRLHIPLDLTLDHPTPSLWPKQYLKASWASTKCQTSKFFNDMSIVFDITLCGDWAGNAYGSSGCPGTCQQQVMTGSNFATASWGVNYVKVYQTT